jgi:hypothetical protein
MAWYNEDNPATLNYVLVGDYHSGYGLLQNSLAVHPQMICHGELLHKDEKVRQAEHEAYFGPSGRLADHFIPTQLSVEQYLNNKIFDNTLCREKAVGVKLNYECIRDYDLWEYLDQKTRKGDFCLLNVERNPVACFVAWKYSQGKDRLSRTRHAPVFVEPQELTKFVRDHLATVAKLRQLGTDRLDIKYTELLLDFRGVLQKVCNFLEISYSHACIPNQKRVKRQNVRDRVANWANLQFTVPGDVQEFLKDPMLF